MVNSVMMIQILGRQEASEKNKQTSSIEKCRFPPPRTTQTLLPTPTERQSWAPQLTRSEKPPDRPTQDQFTIRRKFGSRQDEGINREEKYVVLGDWNADKKC